MAASTSGATEEAKVHVVVLGGGIVGASVAYYGVRDHGDVLRVSVVERTHVAASASGKGGGFLAGGWGDGGVTEELHRNGFALWEEVAAELQLDSYRKVRTLQVQGGAGRRPTGANPSWLDGEASARAMDDATAQVAPHEYTTKAMAVAVGRGAALREGLHAVGFEFADQSDGGAGARVCGVRLSDGTVLEADHVVVAMGVWSALLGDWLGDPGAVPLEGIKSTSIVYEGQEAAANTEPFALFCAEDPRFGTHMEVYPRASGEVYCCGLGGSDYVSGARLRAGGDCDDASKIHADPLRVEAAHAALSSMASFARDAGAPSRSQACMRPCAPDALPLLGRVPGLDNVSIGAGTNCWGLLWGPVVGRALAEQVALGKPTSLSFVPSFDPKRYMARGQAGTRGRKQRGTSVGEQW